MAPTTRQQAHNQGRRSTTRTRNTRPSQPRMTTGGAHSLRRARLGSPHPNSIQADRRESISTPVNEPIMEENEIEVVMQKPPAELGSSQNPIVLGLALSAANNTAITANNDNNNNNNNNDASTSTTAASPTFEVLASLNRDLLEAVSCAICTDIMHRCVVINPCGHKFCAGCLSEWMQASKTCPICRGVVLSTIRDNSMDVIIKLLLDANPERRRPVEELQRLDAHDSGSSQLNDWICRTLLADLMNVHGALSSNSRGSSFRRRRVIRRA